MSVKWLVHKCWGYSQSQELERTQMCSSRWSDNKPRSITPWNPMQSGRGTNYRYTRQPGHINLAVPGLSCGMLTLSCSMWDLVPWTGIDSRLLELRAQSLNHWATGEVPVRLSWNEKTGKNVSGMINVLHSFLMGVVVSFLWPGFLSDYIWVYSLQCRRTPVQFLGWEDPLQKG